MCINRPLSPHRRCRTGSLSVSLTHPPLRYPLFALRRPACGPPRGAAAAPTCTFHFYAHSSDIHFSFIPLDRRSSQGVRPSASLGSSTARISEPAASVHPRLHSRGRRSFAPLVLPKPGPSARQRDGQRYSGVLP